jgi:hypothetical protein
VARVRPGLKLGDQRLGVGDAALGDRLGDRVLIIGAELADLDGGRSEQAGEADPGDALVGAAEDRHVAVVHADVVLLLVEVPGDVRAAAEQDHQQDKRAGHDRPAASAPVTVIVVAVAAGVAAVVVAMAAAAADPAGGGVVVGVLVLAGRPVDAGPVEAVGAGAETVRFERCGVELAGVGVAGPCGPDAGRLLFAHRRLGCGPGQPHRPGRGGALPDGLPRVGRGAGRRRPREHRGPGRRDRADLGVQHVGDDAGDVVGATAADRELDQLERRLVRVPDRAEGLVERLLGDHAGQAVGAEQVTVAWQGVERHQVGLGHRPAVEGAQQQGPVRVRGHVVFGDLALVDQRLDERVVVRDLEELAVAEPVGARVADVAERGVPVRPEQGGQRGAHALDRGIGDDQFLQPQVGRGDRVGERADQVGPEAPRVERGDRGDGGGAGHLTGRVAAHAVGDREQVRASVSRVLVPLAEETDVGADRIAEG